MAVFVFRKANSDSARELSAALGGIRVRGVEDGKFVRWYRPAVRAVRPHRGDAVVCWGEAIAPGLVNGLKVLNGGAVTGKYDQAVTLNRAGVPTVEVSRTRPPVVADPPLNLAAGIYSREQASALINRLQAYIARPIPQATGDWVGRTNNHIGGNDLLVPPQTPDYFSKKIEIIEEYRLHMFNGKSIRAGVKVHRDGVTNRSPWIRSYDGGWSIRYDGFESKKGMRAVAIEACKALGLDFGAVDIGKKADGKYIVLELNRAPGLEGGTVTAYVNAINRWLDGTEQVEV